VRIRIWKTDVWRWRIRRPGYVLAGTAPSWAAAARAVARELGG